MRSLKPNFSSICFAFSTRICRVPEPTFPSPTIATPTSISGNSHLRRVQAFLAYHSNRMRIARRLFLFVLATAEVGLPQTPDPSPSDNPVPPFPRRDHDHNDEKLPNGKSRADAIAE